MKEFFMLKILDLFKGIYQKCGVNYKIMRLIVQSKLVMDGRRGQNVAGFNEDTTKDKNYFFTALIVYAIIGVFSAPIVIMNINPIIKMSLYFSFFMIMILSVFISDFSSVILDINDKDIIVTKGVDSKTLNAAKITHIFIYISLLSLAIGGGGLIASFRYGIMYFVLLLVSILFIDILMIIITASMYFVILKLFSGEKLKDMINTFQIGFLLIFVVGYQFVVRAFSFIDMEFVYVPKVCNILLPPMWFGANFNIFLGDEPNNIIRLLSILSLIVPIVSIFIYIKLIPTFEYNLQKLSDNTYKKIKNKDSLSYKASKIICKNKEERTFFNFVYNVLDKDRDFKTKVYPSLALATFMPFIMMMSSYDSSGIINYINSLSNEKYYLMGYMFVLMSQTIVTTLKFSSQYEASWIYDVLPIKDDKNLYSGMFKASIYKLILPVYIVLSVVFLLIFKAKVIIHLAVMFVAIIVTSMVTFKLNKKERPFSSEYKNTNSGENILTMIKSMFVVGIITIIHFIVSSSLLYTGIYFIVLLLFIKLSWNKIFKV
ncbi:hypothetical protein [Faecalimicrobium sp. JNUCC 81]